MRLVRGRPAAEWTDAHVARTILGLSPKSFVLRLMTAHTALTSLSRSRSENPRIYPTRALSAHCIAPTPTGPRVAGVALRASRCLSLLLTRSICIRARKRRSNASVCDVTGNQQHPRAERRSARTRLHCSPVPSLAEVAQPRNDIRLLVQALIYPPRYLHNE